MNVFETISDQVCCNTAVAAEALADAGNSVLVSGAGWQSFETPAQSAFSYPALLTVGGGNPHSGLAAAVVNEQSPFGLQLGDVAVIDNYGFERIDNNQIFLAQNQLGSDPEKGCCGSNQCSCGNIDEEVAGFSGVENGLGQKQGNERQGHSSPSQIALRAINRSFLHLSIIAGTPADGKGK